MTEIEYKRQICFKLAEVLKLTRAGSEIDTIEYISSDENGDEIALITYMNGGRQKVNIFADSGAALIIDITRAVM